MPEKTISHDQWPTFFAQLAEKWKGAPTTIRVRDHHLEEHEQGLARNLPLASLELDLRPKETLRVAVTQPSGALETVEIEYPKTVSLLEEVGAQNTPDSGASLQIESAALTYFIHIGIVAH